MHREPVVIDCWFDSGSMPFAQWHYPFENKEEFERRFPADYISEAVDQTRGWFETLSALSTILFDKPAFKNCRHRVGTCLRQGNGKKMSKHVGNVVAPADVLTKQGADAVRLVFLHRLQSVAAQPFQRRRRKRDAAQIYGYAVEHICVLRFVRRY